MITRFRLEVSEISLEEAAKRLHETCHVLFKLSRISPIDWKCTQRVIVLNETTGKYDGRIVMKLDSNG